MSLDIEGIAPTVDDSFPRNDPRPTAMPIESRPPWRWVARIWPLADLPRYPRCARTISYHEAGHAVLAAALRLPMTGAEVHADGSGKVSLERLPPPDPDVLIPRATLERAATELAAMYVGGFMAELLLHGLDVQGELWVDTPDWEKALLMLREGFGRNRMPLYYCQRLARAILTERWAQVVAVAAALQQRGTLSAADIEAALNVSARP